jgi:hypothetical protein
VSESTTTLAIIYGLNEGPAHAKVLRRHAEARGLRIISDPREADIVIAHSGGCYFMPEAAKAHTVLAANPVCGPVHHVPLMLGKKVIQDFRICLQNGQLVAWLHKTCWNSVYGLTRTRRNSRMIQLAHTYSRSLPVVTDRQVIVVHNQSDPWAAYLPREAIMERPQYRYLSVAGSHDDLWLHPEIYLDIVQS